MRRLIVMVVLGAVLAMTGLSDTIALRDGKMIEGQIIRTNAVSITVRTATGIQTYRLSELRDNAADTRVSAPSAMPEPMGPTAAQDKKAVSRDPDVSMRNFLLHGILTFRAGQIIWFLGSVLLLIQGFRTSILWGVLVLLTNLIGAIIFLLFHPKRAIVPLLIMLVGIVVFAMAPFWALWGAGVR
jgi:hypothetical protein